jgi:hypothetical protein
VEEAEDGLQAIEMVKTESVSVTVTVTVLLGLGSVLGLELSNILTRHKI